jgi:hypothetical protein
MGVEAWYGGIWHTSAGTALMFPVMLYQSAAQLFLVMLAG